MSSTEPQGWKKSAVRIGALAVVVVSSLVVGVAIGNTWSRSDPWARRITELWEKGITDRQCVRSVLDAYFDANRPFIRESPLAIAEIVDQRRIQERFCLEFIRCFFKSSDDLALSFPFESCLNHNMLNNQYARE